MSHLFQEAIVALMPALRRFALRRARSGAEAEDLVQETLARALRYADTFKEGSNLKSWLFKILQNCLYRDLTSRRNTVQDSDGYLAGRQSVDASQEWHVQCSDVLTALNSLPAESREALMMVSADGHSYEEAAQLSHCPVGTLKSRVNRARERLIELTVDHRGPFHPTARPAAFQQQSPQMSLQRSIKEPSE